MMMQTPWPTRTRALFVPRKTAPPSTQCQRSGLAGPALAQRTQRPCKGRETQRARTPRAARGGRRPANYRYRQSSEFGVQR